MAREAFTIINIDSTVLFIPEGEVYEWVSKRTREIGRKARELCPPGRTMRRGSTRYVNRNVLRASIRTRTTFKGTRLDFGQISVGPADQGGGDYTEFVLGGTAYQGQRYIYSRRGYANKASIDAIITRRGVAALGRAAPADLPIAWAMRFRTDGGRHWRVHGQKSNPFLTDAHNAVARRHPDSMGLFASPFF